MNLYRSSVILSGRSSITQFNILHGQWFGGESFERYSFERCDTTYEFEIKFKLRTRDPNGVIFWAGNPLALDKTLALKIKDSKLELSFAENEPYRYKKAVDDNVWHTVELKFNRGGITLILDHVPRPVSSTKLTRCLSMIFNCPFCNEMFILNRKQTKN